MERSLVTVVVAFAMVATSVQAVEVEAETPSCASKLVPCIEYLNDTAAPPNRCCDPMKEVVNNDLDCMCKLYENPSFMAGININVTQALHLLPLCGVPVDVNACENDDAPRGFDIKPSLGPKSDASKLACSAIFSVFLISAFLLKDFCISL